MKIEVAEVVDRSPIGSYQLRIVLICAFVALLDGLDIQAMALVTPSLREEWGLPASAFGPVISASFAGIMLGMLGLGLLGDKWGRRKVLIGSFILVGVSSVLTGFATSLEELVVYRLLTGVGIGGCLPNVTALTAEFVPASRIAFFVTLMYSAVPLGGVVGGYIGGPIISQFGWSAIFFLGGIVPLILCLVIYFFLPESVRFLARKPGQEDSVGRILEKIDPDFRYSTGDKFTVANSGSNGTLKDLFRDGQASLTLLLWGVFFFSLFGMYMLASWLPTVFVERGWKLDDAIKSVSYFWLGGIFGGLVAGWLIDRFGPYLVLVPGFALGALLTAAIGVWAGDAWTTLVIVLASGFGVVGAQLAMTALAAELYPTHVRSTGVGWGLGVGRVGAVISPIAGGYAVSAGWSHGELFGAAAVPFIICSILALMMGLVAAARQKRRSITALPNKSSEVS